MAHAVEVLVMVLAVWAVAQMVEAQALAKVAREETAQGTVAESMAGEETG